MVRILHALGLLVALAATTSSASAVTWHNSGDTTFTASGGAGTLTTTGTVFVCNGSSFTGTVAAAPFVGVTWSAMTITTTDTSCTVSGQSFPWECRRIFTADSQPATDVTSGTLDTTCDIYAAGIRICHVAGVQSATYVNPIGPSTAGRFQLLTGGTLRTSNGVTNCIVGTGDLLHMSPQTFTLSAATGGPAPHFGPYITRTP